MRKVMGGGGAGVGGGGLRNFWFTGISFSLNAYFFIHLDLHYFVSCFPYPLPPF